jgi:putative acetyltransferase
MAGPVPDDAGESSLNPSMPGPASRPPPLARPDLRVATADDVPALAALYAASAAAGGPRVYTPAQVAAWVSFGQDTPAFRHYILDAVTWVATLPDDARYAGFCGVSSDGEVHSLYVRDDLHGRGLGTVLLRHALSQARAAGIDKFSAWATPLSRPLFERAGLVLDRIVREPYQGEWFDRFRLRTP